MFIIKDLTPGDFLSMNLSAEPGKKVGKKSTFFTVNGLYCTTVTQNHWSEKRKKKIETTTKLD